MVRLVPALLVLGLAALAVLYQQSGPGLIARLASGYLGRHVEIGSAELRVGRSFVIELGEVRVYAGREPVGEPLLEVERAAGRQSWLRLLAGQLLPSSWEVVRPLLRTRLGGEAGTAASASLAALRPLDLELRDGRVEIERPDAAPLRVTDLSMRTTRMGLPVRATGSAAGSVWVGSEPLAHFDVTLDVWSGELALEGVLESIELAALPLGDAGQLRGHGSGRLRASGSAGRLEGELGLELEDFEAELASLSAPLAPQVARLALSASWDGADLEVVADPLQLDALVLTGELTIATAAQRLRASLDFADFAPGKAGRNRLHPLALLGRRFETWANVDRRIEAGRVENLSIRADLPLGGLGEALGFARKLEPTELTIRMDLRDGVYRTSPGAAPLEAISGEVSIEGNRLRVREVRMQREGRPLPHIDVEIDGMHRLVRLPPDERGTPAGPGVGIPGLGAAMRSLQVDGDRPAPVVLLRDFQVGYPAFVLPIRDARGPLRFPAGRVVVDDVEAVIGGAPGRLSAVYDPDANEVAVRVRYLDGEAPAPADPGDYWASGHFSVVTLPLGPWRLDDVAGRLEARGAELAIPHFEAHFSEGPARGFGRFDLGHEAAADFEFFASVRDADASGLTGPLERPAGSIQGKLALDGRFAGKLGPELRFIEAADFGLAVRIEHGSFGDLPALMVLARLPSLQGIRGLFGTQLPFDAVSGDIALRAGTLRTENFALQGPELRAHARGQIDMASQDLDCDFVLAFLFLQTVDRVLGSVPIVGRWVLGEDESLVAITLQVDGSWDDPRVRPVAPGAVQTAAGWAVRVVTSGANQILRVLGGSAPRTEEPSGNGDGTNAGQAP